MTDKHICETLMEYAISSGAKKINELPGLWVSVVDEHWIINVMDIRKKWKACRHLAGT